MTRVVVTLTLDCRNDVPVHILEWMAANLAQHAEHEFDEDYDPSFVRPRYIGPPLIGSVEARAKIIESSRA